MSNNRNYTIPIIEAVLSINPDARLGVSSEDVNQITWHDGNPTNITTQQILDEQAKMQSEFDAKEYARKRKEEYPTIEELVVALYDTDDKSAIEAKRAEVKAKYPKP